MTERRMIVVRTVLAMSCAMGTTEALATAVVTFDNGPEGWVGPAGTFIDAEGGNPGANLHTIFSNFGITFRNSTNKDFATDYTRWPMVRLSIDLKVNRIESFGNPVPRPWSCCSCSVIGARARSHARRYPGGTRRRRWDQDVS